MIRDNLHSKSNILILGYHGINSSLCPSLAGNKYNISYRLFGEQMRWLYSEGYKTITMHDIMNSNMESNRKYIIITFDDGHKSNFDTALPTLTRYNFKAIFFITASFINKNRACMDWNQISQIANEGHEIGSHGYQHLFFSTLSYDSIYHELSRSSRMIEDNIGTKPVSFSCPGGRFNRKVMLISKELGYRKIFHSFPSYYTLQSLSNNFCCGRLMVTSQMSLRKYKSILLRNKYTLIEIKFSCILKNFAKQLLGNRIYHNIYKYCIRNNGTRN